MKKTFRHIIAAMAAITALASCAKDIATEDIINSLSGDGPRTITIGYDTDTKTGQNFDWHKVQFVEGDQIKVMNSSGTETCTIHVNDGVARFTTNLTGELTAVYPPGCGSLNFRTGKITVGTYPSHLQDGTLASGHIASATIASGSTKATFHNETALLRVITPAGAKQLTVTSLNENVKISDGEIANGSILTEATFSIVVGDGTKELGTCYVSIHPGAKIGALSFDAGVGTKRVSSTADINAGVAYTISGDGWDIPATGITLNKTALSLEIGKTFNLEATVQPSTVSNKNVKWASSNTSVASVDSKGAVTALSKGTARIAASIGSVKAYCDVTVTSTPVTGISLNQTSMTLEIGQRYNLNATVSPSNATDKSVTWSSSNTSVATVTDYGLVTPEGVGTTTITATTVDGSKKATCTVTVKIGDVLPGVFSVSPTKKVRFSKGNLQAIYDGSKYVWVFAAEQYASIGQSPGNTTIDSPKYGATVDLFGWSTSTTNYGLSKSTSNEDYSGDFVDWGKNFGDGSTWYTLSINEWKYLLEGDGSTQCPRNSMAAVAVTVVGIENCLIIYPDGYTGTKAKRLDKTTYDTYDKWIAAQNAGAVCLPVTGWRTGALANYPDIDGAYWSSTPYGGSNAYFVLTGEYYGNGTKNRYVGCAVRLVTDVK